MDRSTLTVILFFAGFACTWLCCLTYRIMRSLRHIEALLERSKP